MKVRLLLVLAGTGVVSACSTAESYSTERQLAVQATQVQAAADEPLIRVGPEGPLMTQRALEQERLRRLRDRVRTNPGLAGKVEHYGLDDGDYGDVLRR